MPEHGIPGTEKVTPDDLSHLWHEVYDMAKDNPLSINYVTSNGAMLIELVKITGKYYGADGVKVLKAMVTLLCDDIIDFIKNPEEYKAKRDAESNAKRVQD